MFGRGYLVKSWADFVDFTLLKLEVLPLREGGESFSKVLLARGVVSDGCRKDLWVEPECCGCGLEEVVAAAVVVEETLDNGCG